MGDKRLIESHYWDMNNLVDVLCRLVTSYRAVVGGAAELNGVALADKRHVKEALKTADEINELIRDVIDTLEECEDCYLCYCRIRAGVIKSRLDAQYILGEIDEEFGDLKKNLKSIDINKLYTHKGKHKKVKRKENISKGNDEEEEDSSEEDNGDSKDGKTPPLNKEE